jgi:hypothetical protein
MRLAPLALAAFCFIPITVPSTARRDAKSRNLHDSSRKSQKSLFIRSLIDFRHVWLVKILYFSFFALQRLRISPVGQ